MQQLSIIKFMIRQMVLAVVVLIMLGNQKKETLVFEFCSYMSRCKRRLCSCVPVNCNFITFSVQIFLIPTIDFIFDLPHDYSLLLPKDLRLNPLIFQMEGLSMSYSGVVIFLSLLYFKTTLTSSSPASSCSPALSSKEIPLRNPLNPTKLLLLLKTLSAQLL
ncbi:uncharacterized protein LOC103949860 isoform X11 [Pyrus x bretschneideri]|uniref:uncharacterized protein LOC103949860 isoform X11 n=1 Tax=Pyrus x bretschneideri TaxID=225117 RepID=UPI00202FA4BD|nr:uncharacterized protein LOC103949860 isoform X11 [Pyrus x bretschneideri]